MPGESLVIIFNETYKWLQYIFFFDVIEDFFDKVVKSLLSFIILMDLKDLSFLIRKEIMEGKKESFGPDTFFHFLNNLFIVNGWNSS